MNGRAWVRVPATSANLGPGFDCLGLALELFLEVHAAVADRDVFRYRGEGSVPETPDNLIHQGFRAAYAHLGRTPPPVAIEADNPIPLARGLGSSSAALVAGAALADALLDGALGRDGVFAVTAAIEGHPDNVAPAVYGGFTVSVATDAGYLSTALPLPPSWRLLFAVPTFTLSTERARQVLPRRYERSALVHNASRTALWSLAVATDRPELLRVAAQDAAHEPYREPLVPGLAATRAAVLAAGGDAAFLSGAGPAVGVICRDPARDACRAVLEQFVGPDGRVLELRPAAGYHAARVADDAPVADS